MTITEKSIFNCIFNSQECEIPESSLKFNQTEEVNKILETFYTSIDFLPLVRFINEGDTTFETSLNEIEEKEISNSNEQPLPQRKIKYHLRPRPYRSFQKESDSLEDKKQHILNLIHSGIPKADIEKKYDIRAETLREWYELSPWSGWRNRKRKR